MQVYLLHEKYYENHDLHLALEAHNVYVYRTYEGAMQRIVDETGKSIEEIKRFLSTGDNTVPSGDWDYEIEETELL